MPGQRDDDHLWNLLDGEPVAPEPSKPEEADAKATSSGQDNPNTPPAPPGSGFGRKLLKDIQDLMKEQKTARDHKAAVAKELKNAKRRSNRLKRKASTMTMEDLVAVMELRTEAATSNNKTAGPGACPDAAASTAAGAA